MSETTADCDYFTHDDAAYVFGALEPDEHLAFAAHLAACPRCAAQVAGLKAATAALASVGPEDLVIPGEQVDERAPGAQDAPETLLPAMLADVRRRRRQRGWAMGGLAGLAAAAVAALIVALAVRPVGDPSAELADTGTAMTAVADTVPLEATAALTDEAWGTRISLDCYYTGVASGSGYATGQVAYSLRVTERDGSRHELGSWTLSTTGETHFTSGIAVPPAQIETVSVLLPDGAPALRLHP